LKSCVPLADIQLSNTKLSRCLQQHQWGRATSSWRPHAIFTISPSAVGCQKLQTRRNYICVGTTVITLSQRLADTSIPHDALRQTSMTPSPSAAINDPRRCLDASPCNIHDRGMRRPERHWLDNWKL
jgi:hypothetical protein